MCLQQGGVLHALCIAGHRQCWCRDSPCSDKLAVKRPPKVCRQRNGNFGPPARHMEKHRFWWLNNAADDILWAIVSDVVLWIKVKLTWTSAIPLIAHEFSRPGWPARTTPLKWVIPSASCLMLLISAVPREVARRAISAPLILLIRIRFMTSMRMLGVKSAGTVGDLGNLKLSTKGMSSPDVKHKGAGMAS